MNKRDKDRINKITNTSILKLLKLLRSKREVKNKFTFSPSVKNGARNICIETSRFVNKKYKSKNKIFNTKNIFI